MIVTEYGTTPDGITRLWSEAIFIDHHTVTANADTLTRAEKLIVEDDRAVLQRLPAAVAA